MVDSLTCALGFVSRCKINVRILRIISLYSYPKEHTRDQK